MRLTSRRGRCRAGVQHKGRGVTGAAAPSRLRRITADEAFPLRFGILRRSLPPAESHYRRDDDPASVHLGVFVDGRLVSVGSLLPDPQEDGVTEGVFRLRGMVTVPECRGRGLGGMLLDHGVALVARQGGRLIWCNGRTGAVPFYERHGFSPVGEEFETPGTGPHFRFVRPIIEADRTQSP